QQLAEHNRLLDLAIAAAPRSARNRREQRPASARGYGRLAPGGLLGSRQAILAPLALRLWWGGEQPPDARLDGVATMVVDEPGLSTTPILQVRDLRTKLLKPASLSLSAGECIAVYGPSGAGKTLLLRALADLDPSDGVVCLNGRDRTAISG